MNDNPLKVADSRDDGGEASNNEQRGSRSQGSNRANGSVQQRVNELQARIDELERSQENSQEEIERLRSELEEARKPEPEYDCPSGDCDGWAAEELEPNHVETEDPMLQSKRVSSIECPRCGEKMEPIEANPETERGVLNKGMTESAKKGNAKRDMTKELQEKGRERVVE